jgi:hypothetical protein
MKKTLKAPLKVRYLIHLSTILLLASYTKALLLDTLDDCPMQ